MIADTQYLDSLNKRIGLFLALSRTPHGLLDLATPAFAALLGYGCFPSLYVTLLGLLTAFAGYTAVYALNDLVDVGSDRAKLDSSDHAMGDGYLDAVGVRHPVAQGLLSRRAAFFWFGLWAAVAMVGAYALNPVCLYLFMGGAALEIIYCLLLKVSPLRTLISGLVKTIGGVAAVYAVDPEPSPWFLILLWAWLFSWEIGGQNVPADWYDIEEDRGLGARTLPVVYGPRRASLIILSSLMLTVALSVALVIFAPLRIPWSLAIVSWAAGCSLLILPAWELWRGQTLQGATRLFNRASYYPLTMLGIALISMLVDSLYP